MPLVRIDLLEGRSESELAAIRAAVHRALTECFDVPQRDQFQVITEHRKGRLIYDPGYLGVERSDGMVFVQVILSAGRSADQKTAFYARTVELISMGAPVRPQDVTIILVENTRENWSFGNGVAQYLTMPSDQWK
jgi:phenylpyruvate tautomerase PptA (4-oxalocrotonate tautomerase family)